MKPLVLSSALILCFLALQGQAGGLHRRKKVARVYGQSVINWDGTVVGKSLAAVIRVPREEPSNSQFLQEDQDLDLRANEMPNDEPDPSAGKEIAFSTQNQWWH